MKNFLIGAGLLVGAGLAYKAYKNSQESTSEETTTDDNVLDKTKQSGRTAADNYVDTTKEQGRTAAKKETPSPPVPSPPQLMINPIMKPIVAEFHAAVLNSGASVRSM